MEKNYDVYLEQCLKVGSLPLSKEEYESGDLKFSTAATTVASSFVGDFARGVASNMGTRMSRGENFNTALKGSLIDEGFNVVNTVLPERITIDLTGKGNAGSSSKPPRGTPPLRDAESNPGNNNYLQGSYTTNPASINLSTGINSQVYSDPYNYPINGAVSFLHLTGCRLQLGSSSPYVREFMEKVLIPYLQNRAQLTVSFRVDVSIISYSAVSGYIELLMEALQVYYFYSSIISYTSVPLNPDRGMFALRNMISADDLDYLGQLRMLLGTLPIPPNLNKLCFWLNQTYSDGPSSQGLIKFMPIPFNAAVSSNEVSTFGGTNSSLLKDLISRITSSTSYGIVPLLTRVCPEWVDEDVMDPSPVPLYSPDFSTVWANFPYVSYGGGVTKYGPTVAARTTYLNTYCSYSPNPDGLVVGLGNIAVNEPTVAFADAVWVNNLMKIIPTNHVFGGTTLFSNRYSYIQKSDSNYYFASSQTQIESAIGRPETRKLYDITPYFTRIPDTYRIANVTPTLYDFVGRDLLTWFMSLESIKDKKGGKKYFDSTKSPKG